MSHAQKISITFEVDSGVDGGRLMDEVLAFIQAKEGTYCARANYERTTTQWWTNPIPSFPDECPPMTRQPATGGATVEESFPWEAGIHLEVDEPEWSTAAAADIPASGAGADPVREDDETASTITNASSIAVEQKDEEFPQMVPLTLRKYKRAFLLEGDVDVSYNVVCGVSG